MKHPFLALLAAPFLGLALIVALPFLGWFVLIGAIVARLRQHPATQPDILSA
jgi:hypothetical protein